MGGFLHRNASAKIRNRVLPPTMYSVYSDYESGWRGEYSYLIGCGVTRSGPVPEGMETRKIPAQTYAVFTAKGRMPDEVLAVWSMVWLSELPRTYTFDFEVYDKRFTNPNRKEVDVCVAVDPEKMEQAWQSALKVSPSFFLLWRNHLILIPFWAPPPPLRHSEGASHLLEPSSLSADEGFPRLRACHITYTQSWRNFRTGNVEASQCAPAPSGVLMVLRPEAGEERFSVL